MAGVFLREPDLAIARRAMFALEFIDPVTGRIVGDGLRPSVDGLPAPRKGQSGRFVWLEDGAPVERDITVKLAIDNPMYGQPTQPSDLTFTVPANDASVPPSALLKRFTLSLSARYFPPEGVTGVTSMIVEAVNDATPLTDAAFALCVLHDEDQRFTSNREVRCDGGGAFIAFVDDLRDIVPQPAPKDLDGDILGWLRVTRPESQARFTKFLPLRRGRMTQLRERIVWAELHEQTPELPHP